jgi:hypothetical protein
MKMRIHSIVTDLCGNARIVTRRALAISALAAMMVVAAAVAQPGPAESMGPEPMAGPVTAEPQARPEPRGRQDLLDPVQAGRRNVLSRLRDQLQLQIREAEANLRNEPHPEPSAQVLRSELETLREQMHMIERQLNQLGQGQGRNRPEGMGREGQMPQASEQRGAELRRLRMREAEIRARLGNLEDEDGEEARDLRQELGQLRVRRERLERALQGGEPIEGRIQGQRPEAEVRRQPVGGEMVTTVYRLQYADAGQMQKIVASLLTPAGKVNSDERTGSLIITDLPESHKRIQSIIMELDVQGPEGRRGAGGAEVAELRSQVKALKEQLQKMQAALDQMAGQKGKGKAQPQQQD